MSQEEAVDDVESGRRDDSNTNTSIPNSPVHNNHQQKHHQASSPHFSAATGLIVTYLIEIGVQIFLMVNCCRSFVLVVSDWDWPWFLTISSTLSSLLVTIVSIIWVCRGLDFAGRLCGRLLCYVMHSLLLGLLWRYLKLAFAYDHADVKEFVTLRVFQTYIQSLPLTSIHLAWLITFRENCSSLTFCLVVAEMLSVATALAISSYIKSEEEKEGKAVVSFESHPKCNSTAIWFKVIRAELSVLGRVMLICCRLIVVGIVIVHLKYWTSVIVLVHFVVCFAWVSFSEKMCESTKTSNGQLNLTGETRVLNKNKFVARVSRFVYVLFWDVSLNLVGGMNLWTCTLPVLLMIVENTAMIMFHWYYQPDFFVTTTSATCLFFGLLLRFSLNFISVINNTMCCSLSRMQSKKKDKSQQTQSLPVIDPPEKTESEDSHKVNTENDGVSIERIAGLSSTTEQNKSCSWDLPIGKPFIVANNYTNISEVLMTKARVRAGGVNGEKRRKNLMKGMSGPPEVLVHRVSLPATPEASVPTLIQSPLVPTTTWVPDTCCNDSNGSSNSRNTNTLLDSANHPTDQDNDMDIDNTHFVFYYPNKTNVTPTAACELRKSSQRSGSVSVTNSTKQRRGSMRRNTKKKSNSPANSFTSFSSLPKIRTSTPVEIRKASRVIMNYPKHNKVPNSKTVSRCFCQIEQAAPCSGEIIGNDLYDKLMEDSYGILICEGETSQGRRVCENKDETRPPSRLPSMFHANKKLKVLCAKCLQNHDPLLTNCLEEDEVAIHSIHPPTTTADSLRYHSSIAHLTNCRVPPIPSIVSVMPHVPSDSTDYPSETEMTWTLHGDDQISMSSHLSTATYTTWPHQSQPNLSMWTTSTMMPQSRFPKEFTSLEYVRTWLLTSQARLRHYQHEKNRAAKKVNRSKTPTSQNTRRAAVRSASVGKKEVIQSESYRNSNSNKGLGRRHGPVGRGTSPQSYHEVVLPITPSFQPPPRQKQHPVLPLSVIPHHVEMCTHPDCPQHSVFNRSNDPSDVCYKDLEIVV